MLDEIKDKLCKETFEKFDIYVMSNDLVDKHIKGKKYTYLELKRKNRQNYA